MSACAVALLIVNHKKQKMVDEYKSLLQKYGKGCNTTDDVGKLKENIESADKLIKEQKEMIEELKITYNRARQTAITTEITEIVSGSGS